MRRVNPKLIAAVLIGLLVLIVAFVMMSRRGKSEQDKLSDTQAAGAAATAPQTRCGTQATYDRIKVELFRQAAQVRKSDQGVFDKLAAYASVRMERPLLRSRDDELGTVRCTGRLSLDLPPGVAVVGGRRTLAADIDYVLQPAADGSGDVVMLEGDGPITVPLATLARSGETRVAAGGDLPAVVAEPVAAEPPMPTPAAVPPPRQTTQTARGFEPDTAKAKPEPVAAPPTAVRPDRAPVRTTDRTRGQSPKAAARPSFNCRYARTRGEIAICKDAGLAALDRQMASQYYRAIASANAAQRRDLKASRDAFLRRRDGCRQAACIANSYQERMREIGEIRSNR